MNKKFLTLSTVAAITISSVLPISSNVQAEEIKVHTLEQKENNTVNLQTLIENYKISNEFVEGTAYTVSYENNGNMHKVVYNRDSGKVYIDGVLQNDVTYEYDPALASPLQNTTNTNSLRVSTLSIYPELESTDGGSYVPITGYKYVGTLKGKTDEAKNLATLFTGLVLAIPGINYYTAAGTLFAGYLYDEHIPELYYTYHLYEKGAMTNNWYQYTRVRFYEDAARLEPTGNWWTSSPKPIYLPNS